MVIGLEDFTEIKKLTAPLLLAGFTQAKFTTRDSLNHKVVLSPLVPFKENVFDGEIIHPLQFKVGTVTGVRARIDHFSLAAPALAFGQQRHPGLQGLTQILER